MQSRSYFVPNLREAFGFHFIDIVLEMTLTSAMYDQRSVYAHSNVAPANIDNENYKSNRYNENNNDTNTKNIGSSSDQCNKYAKNNSNGNVYRNVDSNGKNEKKRTRNETEREFESGNSFQIKSTVTMKDSVGEEVKFNFYNIEQLSSLVDRFTTSTEFVKLKKNNIQLFCKSVSVDSVFANRITRLQACPLSVFTILNDQDPGYRSVS